MELTDEDIRSGVHQEVDKIVAPPNMWNVVRSRLDRKPGVTALRRAAVVAALSLAVLMVIPTPRAFTLELIRSVVSVLEWKPPAVGTVVKWEDLPTVVQEVLDNGITSPDGRWVAGVWSWTQVSPDVRMAIEDEKASFDPAIFKTSPQLWVASADRRSARLVKAGFEGTNEQFLWSPTSTLLFYQWEDDSWQAVTPSSGRTTSYLPSLLKGCFAGSLRFSPDGKQLLYNTGASRLTNKPSPAPQVTYLANIDGTQEREIGVDVDARWDGGKIASVPLPPDVIFATPFPFGSVWTLNKGDKVVAMVRAASSVEWRVYQGKPQTDEKPVAVLPAQETEPGVWTVDWPGWTSDHFYLVLYAKARSGVELETGLVAEGSSIWVMRGPFEVVSGK